ncbi:MAG: hypothetical protein WKF80_12320, partial [Thermomicrobiales bacterium]
MGGVAAMGGITADPVRAGPSARGDAGGDARGAGGRDGWPGVFEGEGPGAVVGTDDVEGRGRAGLVDHPVVTATGGRREPANTLDR